MKNFSNVQEHHCEDKDFPIGKFFQIGKGKGNKILIIGESLPKSGWKKSGSVFYKEDGKILPTGRVLNKLLSKFDLCVENCGFTEIAKCHIGKERKLINVCGAKCWKIFLKQAGFRDFKLIIILGKKTLEVFNEQLNADFKTGELAKIFLNKREYHLLPIFHPSPANPYGYVKNSEIFDRLYKDLISIADLQ